jgi:hypothetical protein
MTGWVANAWWSVTHIEIDVAYFKVQCFSLGARSKKNKSQCAAGVGGKYFKTGFREIRNGPEKFGATAISNCPPGGEGGGRQSGRGVNILA